VRGDDVWEKKKKKEKQTSVHPDAFIGFMGVSEAEVLICSSHSDWVCS